MSMASPNKTRKHNGVPQCVCEKRELHTHAGVLSFL